MSRNVSIGRLGEAIEQELSIYNARVTEAINDAGKKSMKDMVRITKATAPVGARGEFKKNIAMKETTDGHGMKRYIWYVKPPDHRLTHLIVHGHATKDGGRTAPNPFLANACDQVLPEYSQAIREALQR